MYIIYFTKDDTGAWNGKDLHRKNRKSIFKGQKHCNDSIPVQEFKTLLVDIFSLLLISQSVMRASEGAHPGRY